MALDDKTLDRLKALGTYFSERGLNFMWMDHRKITEGDETYSIIVSRREIVLSEISAEEYFDNNFALLRVPEAQFLCTIIGMLFIISNHANCK